MSILLLICLLSQTDSLDDLIRRLGSEAFQAREKAFKEIVKAGRKDLEVRRRIAALARETKDPEVRLRARMALVEIDWSRTPGIPVPPREYSVWAADVDRIAFWGGRDQGGRRTDGAIYQGGEWHALPAVEIEPRVAMTVTLAGDHLVVWSGGDHPRYFADGVVYDLRTRASRKIPPAPIVGRARPSVANLGGKILFWGGVLDSTLLVQSEGPVQTMGFPLPRYPNDGAILDLATLEWKKMADTPVQGRDCRALWDGERLVFLGGEREEGFNVYLAQSDGGIYEPARDEWSRIPKSPAGEVKALWKTDRGVLALGEGAALFDGEDWQPLPEPPPKVEFRGLWNGRLLARSRYYGMTGAILDLPTRQWLEIPRPPLSERIYMNELWNGETLILSGGHDARKKEKYDYFQDGARWDVGAKEWTPIKDCPLDVGMHNSWSRTSNDRYIVIWRGQILRSNKGRREPPEVFTFDDGAIYDSRRDEWSLIPSVGPLERWIRDPKLFWLKGRLLAVAPDVSRAVLWTPPRGE